MELGCVIFTNVDIQIDKTGNFKGGCMGLPVFFWIVWTKFYANI